TGRGAAAGCLERRAAAAGALARPRGESVRLAAGAARAGDLARMLPGGGAGPHGLVAVPWRQAGGWWGYRRAGGAQAGWFLRRPVCADLWGPRNGCRIRATRVTVGIREANNGW